MVDTVLDPVIQEVEVPCRQQQAFTAFVDMGNWWPLEKRSMSLMHGGAPAKALNVDARVGGRIVETGADDAEHHWGTFTAFDPHGSVAMDFHMGMPAENASLVTVEFEPLADDRTKVRLTHSKWEAFGDMAEMMRGGYGASWSLILEPYVIACGG